MPITGVRRRRCSTDWSDSSALQSPTRHCGRPRPRPIGSAACNASCSKSAGPRSCRAWMRCKRLARVTSCRRTTTPPPGTLSPGTASDPRDLAGRPPPGAALGAAVAPPSASNAGGARARWSSPRTTAGARARRAPTSRRPARPSKASSSSTGWIRPLTNVYPAETREAWFVDATWSDQNSMAWSSICRRPIVSSAGTTRA